MDLQLLHWRLPRLKFCRNALRFVCSCSKSPHRIRRAYGGRVCLPMLQTAYWRQVCCGDDGLSSSLLRGYPSPCTCPTHDHSQTARSKAWVRREAQAVSAGQSCACLPAWPFPQPWHGYRSPRWPTTCAAPFQRHIGPIPRSKQHGLTSARSTRPCRSRSPKACPMPRHRPAIPNPSTTVAGP